MSAVPIWPCALPRCVLRDGWGLELSDPNRRTEMDSGRIAVAPRVSRIRAEHGAAWRMSPDQLEVFKGFWSRDLRGGRLWFDGPLFDGRCTRARRLRFVKLERITAIGGGWLRVPALIETAEIPQASAGDQEAFAVELLTGGAEAYAAELEEILSLWPKGGPS